MTENKNRKMALKMKAALAQVDVMREENAAKDQALADAAAEKYAADVLFNKENLKNLQDSDLATKIKADRKKLVEKYQKELQEERARA